MPYVSAEKLRFWEIPGYGVKQPQDVHHGEADGYFDFQIRGVPERLIRMETFQVDGQCRARALTDIVDGKAVLEYILITVSGWANVHQVEIFGISAGGQPVNEITFQKD